MCVRFGIAIVTRADGLLLPPLNVRFERWADPSRLCTGSDAAVDSRSCPSSCTARRIAVSGPNDTSSKSSASSSEAFDFSATEIVTADAAAAMRPSDPATRSASSPPAAMTCAQASHASPTALIGSEAYRGPVRRIAAAKRGRRSWNDGSAATRGDRASVAHTASASACDAVTCSALVSLVSPSRGFASIASNRPSSRSPSPSEDPSCAVLTTAVARSMEVRNRANPSASATATSASWSRPWTSLVTRTMPMNLRSRLSLERSRTHSDSVASWSPIVSPPTRSPARESERGCRIVSEFSTH